MKKFYSFACYALVAPVLAFGTVSLMANAAGDEDNDRNRSGMQNTGFLDAVPANGMHASNLIGAEVMTDGDEDVGSISELIIDESGQVIAVVVGVGGFLGMGEKDVAIGWDDINRSGTGEDQELRVSLTRDDLGTAPMFEDLD